MHGFISYKHGLLIVPHILLAPSWFVSLNVNKNFFSFPEIFSFYVVGV